MKDLIKRYLKLKIQYATIGIKNLKRQEEILKQMAEITAGHQILLDEYKKDSYKTKYQEEHKKFKNYQKDAKEIIDRYESTIKDLQREVK